MRPGSELSYCGGTCDTCDGCADCLTIKSAAALLGKKGGAAGTGASKRRNVDYAALGRKGGLAGKGASKARK